MEVKTIGRATLYLGDCREILPTLGKVDAVVTDPPYGVGFAYASYDDAEDRHPEHCRAWLEMFRATTEGPIAIATGRKHLMAWPQPNWVLCWHKPACMGPAPIGFTNWEPVLLYGKSRGPKTVDYFRAPIVPSDDVAGHPCPKPVGWGLGLVGKLTLPNDTVLDPFAGSGTTGVAAVKLGRNFIGCEIEPRYFDIACKRLEDAQRQGDFFVEAA